MDINGFKKLLEEAAPPEDLNPLLKALWLERKGDWDQAHQIAQEIPTRSGSWVHAYLHRVEGDLGNARYWYRRADRPESRLSLTEEWEEIAESILGNG